MTQSNAGARVAVALAVAALFGVNCACAQAADQRPLLAADAVREVTPAVVLVIDRADVLRRSAAGKSMYAQVEVLTMKIEADLRPEEKAIEADAQMLRKVPRPDADRQQVLVQGLEARRQAFQQKIRDRQVALQTGLEKARSQVEAALGTILNEIMIERGANFMIDKSLVVLGPSDLDVTNRTIARLNIMLPKVIVTPR